MTTKPARAAVENQVRLLARNAVFQRHGYDTNSNTAFILAQALPLAGRILEIGTGKGRFLTALLAHVPRVITIDVVPDEQHYARLNMVQAKLPGRAHFMIASAENLPWPDHYFGSVVSVNALHHIKDIPRVIGEILRVTHPAGKIVLADFNAHGFAIMRKIHRAEGRIHEQVPYRFRDIAGIFIAQGWRTVMRHDDCQTVLVAGRTHDSGHKMRKGPPASRDYKTSPKHPKPWRKS